MGMAVILVMWPKYFHKFWLTNHKEFLHKIWVQLNQWFVRNHVLLYWWDSNMSDLSWKVNLDLWNLFIAIVSLGLTYQENIMTEASTVF